MVTREIILFAIILAMLVFSLISKLDDSNLTNPKRLSIFITSLTLAVFSFMLGISTEL